MRILFTFFAAHGQFLNTPMMSRRSHPGIFATPPHFHEGALTVAAGRSVNPERAGSLRLMDYLVGASRVQLIRMQHLEPGTRVLATERIPSGACHAVSGPDAAEGLCGAEVVEVLDQSFTGDNEYLKCEDCEKLVAAG